MPLILEENSHKFVFIGVWHCTESLGELEAEYSLPESDLLEIKNTALHKRKIEKFITRNLSKYLLEKHFSKQYYGLERQITGKPSFINHDTELSVSHCENYLTVLITNKKKAGIDLQNINEKIQKVAHRIFSDEELIEINKKSDLLARAWSAKEAMFKYYEKGKINFKQHLVLKNISNLDTFHGILCSQNTEETIQLYVLQISKSYQLVYCFEK